MSPFSRHPTRPRAGREIPVPDRQTDRQGFLGQTAGRGPFRSVSGEYLAQCREQSTVHASEISSVLESVAGLMGRSGLTKPGGC